ncbi:MAG: hypothetical protein AVO33_01395 [delta proteobacterium ML8_F1]|nr:MAG: hypothetical protein AVO33_01395 [delta proteobacterium ML8_F1]
MKPEQPLIEVRNLKKHFPVKAPFLSGEKLLVKAVDGLDFNIYPGETLGLVGESGCGKSTTGRLLLRLLEPTDGQVFFDGEDITALSQQALKPLRRNFQMVFQDPYACLNPRLKVRDILNEPLVTHHVNPKERKKMILTLLEQVGIPKSYMDRYPHEFSGGQRQRIGIARALSLNPRFIVADEPVAALDVSIQAQILNLMKDLQRDLNLTYLFIAHDLSVVQYISDRIGVMYLGQLVELTETLKLFDNPSHPYTRVLLSAVPVPDPEHVYPESTLAKGEIPSPINPPSGCTFHPRCPHAMAICSREKPLIKDIGGGHKVACHLY